MKTSTGIWSVVYNAENRPTSFTNADSGTVVECTYDYMGRRATKKVTVNGSVTLHQRYLYRGYLQIACCDLTRSNHPCLWLITWDPSQPVATRPLAIQKDGTWYTYGWDLTKNICEVYGQHGYIRTNYTYSPYGEVTISGDVTQPIQWSSEYADSEIDLVYYNYRHYSPMDGRWLGRDTVDKIENAYRFISNLVSLKNDYLGNYEIASEEITDEKIDIAMAIGWYDAISIKDADDQAWNCASKSGYIDSWGGNNDAIRHCTWVCKMAQKIGYEQAIEVGDIHETYSPPTPPQGARRVHGYENLEKWAKEDIAMDKHNNQIGATLGASDCNMDCCHACIAKLDEKVLQVNAPGGYLFLR